MNKRDFVKTVATASVAGLAGCRQLEEINHALTQPTQPLNQPSTIQNTNRFAMKNWIWTRPNVRDTDVILKERFQMWKANGITGAFFEDYDERTYRIAHNEGLETHRWMWTLNRGEDWVRKNHPEWYAVNRKGESCATKPPYVDYYRWLCPSRPEVHEYLAQQYAAQLDLPYVDGIHLDYVRYCDVILPVNLWDKYKIVQTSELPEYDFCYCEVCRANYKAQKDIDPRDIEFPSESPSWKKFRYDNVVRLVHRLTEVAHGKKKPITAAVFPTPDIAKRIVRQDWVRWNLDGICPMIYHGFYREDVSWIYEATQQGIEALNGRYPLYAGLYLPDFKNIQEFGIGVANAYKAGASGVSLFGSVTAEHLRQVTDAMRQFG
jgi:uncharacterized lipoprotein YddW (UPF0748 family)